MSHATHLCFLFPVRKRLQDPHVYDGTEKSCFKFFLKPLKLLVIFVHKTLLLINQLNKISELEDYFIAEIKERELMSKKLSKYISFFDYFDKSLIVLSVTSGGVSIASFATVIGAPTGITSASLSLAFSFCTGLVKKLLKATKNKKKNHNKIVMLARSKLNSIESKISEALINNQISHEDFITIINEERNYRDLKESIRMMKGQEDTKIDID